MTTRRVLHVMSRRLGAFWTSLSADSGSGVARLHRERRPQREVVVPLVVGPHREHVVELDLVALEPQPRAGHVQAPDPRGALADLGDARVPVLLEVAAPARQGL